MKINDHSRPFYSLENRAFFAYRRTSAVSLLFGKSRVFREIPENFGPQLRWYAVQEFPLAKFWGGGFRVSQFRAAAVGAPVSGVRKGGRVVLLRGGGQAGPGEPSDWSARRAMRTEP